MFGAIGFIVILKLVVLQFVDIEGVLQVHDLGLHHSKDLLRVLGQVQPEIRGECTEDPHPVLHHIVLPLVEQVLHLREVLHHAVREPIDHHLYLLAPLLVLRGVHRNHPDVLQKVLRIDVHQRQDPLHHIPFPTPALPSHRLHLYHQDLRKVLLALSEVIQRDFDLLKNYQQQVAKALLYNLSRFFLISLNCYFLEHFHQLPDSEQFINAVD